MDYIKFLKLANKRLRGKKEGNYSNYLAFQNFQAREILKELKKRKIDISNMDMLELSAGLGGYSTIFKKHVKSLIVTDLEKPAVCNKFNIPFKLVDVTQKFPFDDNSFDFVFASSLIEHINNPEIMIKEIKRILRPNGLLYLSFPPFYSPVGSHAVKPFHYLGEKIAIKITNKIKKRDIKSYETMFGEFGLYRITIKSIKKLLVKNNFKIIDTWTRFSPINTAKIPILGEFLTWHACFVGRNKK